jgi:hypothetical protein
LKETILAFLKSTNELKQEVLRICGELQDGTSSYDSDVVSYLNDHYQGILAGGNEFGIDVAEPWIWAQAKRPMLIQLNAVYSGTVSIAQNAQVGTFSAAPSISLAGRYFRISGDTEIYRILFHTAASTSFTLDQPFIATSVVTTDYDAFKLDYDLTDDTLVIDATNNKIDFKEGSPQLTATLTSGVYTPTTLCAEIKSKMEAAGSGTYTVSFDSVTRKFTIAHGSAFVLMFATGTNVSVSTSELLGYEMEDTSSAVSQVATYALNGILRISKPMTMYKEAPTYGQASRDAGKIFMLDDNTFLREYPMNRLVQQIPDKFCVVQTTKEGLWKIRFNASVTEEMRAEVNYIPIQRKLVDSTSSYPLIPGSYVQYLVFAAAYSILMDKADNKAPQYSQLAQAKLRALVNDNRKGLSLGGNNYGKLVPRRGQTRIYGYSTRS